MPLVRPNRCLRPRPIAGADQRASPQERGSDSRTIGHLSETAEPVAAAITAAMARRSRGRRGARGAGPPPPPPPDAGVEPTGPFHEVHLLSPRKNPGPLLSTRVYPTQILCGCALFADVISVDFVFASDIAVPLHDFGVFPCRMRGRLFLL